MDVWNKEISLKMCKEFQQKAQTISDKPWVCIVDLTQWELSSPDVWEPIDNVNVWCTENGQELEAVICTNDLQKDIMGLTHKSLPQTESEFFCDETEAKKWINTFGYNI